jgi:hypothetical protein
LCPGNPLFIQFEADEIRSFTREDWDVIYGLKISPRCNEIKHHECTTELREIDGDDKGKEVNFSRVVHWMHDDTQIDNKKWPWCACTCHSLLAQKAKWMRENLPSYKGKA